MSYTIHNPARAGTPVKGVLFDMDGVILDTEKLYFRFWQEAAHQLGFPMTPEQALGMRSLNHTLGEARLKEWFGPSVDYRQVRSTRIALMDEYLALHGAEPKPGIFELLDFLESRGIPFAVTTSSPLERVRRCMAPHDLERRFSAIVTAYDVPRGKPEPDIYLAGAKALGLSPENCMALEDSPTGILSAYRAGCLSVMVPDLDPPGPETLPYLYAQADSLLDIIDLI